MSGDENLWRREFESGPLDDPESFSWTRKAADRGREDLNLGFLDGNLVSIDNENMTLIKAMSILNQKVGTFGHGRFVGLEHISSGEMFLRFVKRLQQPSSWTLCATWKKRLSAPVRSS
ncbi:argininosuccinate synthase (plasmid) [Agrobacterium vitis]|uniref:argininosuccinate synthase n=1 Tax=Agrobacterium vitis TaxID=373 RepID=UPI001F32BBC7|nr:argininosuccinate synthase [Agrobacterium vitis]